jgi:D-threo-aldose 1-dehydrogenase
MTSNVSPSNTSRLGKTDLFVPRLGLGTAPLAHPSFINAVSREEAGRTVRYALSKGIHLIDTAPHYGFGQSEVILGEALKEVPRDQYVLASKVGRLVVFG